ncbi:hypothetical protein CEE37_08110 [candidate division LCP-89 bacterium B3_LCP]|uniref:Flagellar biosynthesis protein FlgN n=1 Tax=candidate division LCP-89 bacterium B3_LCP TaxID=2012998 RepID=A0A532UZA1_UNCL8|nr:MAG: hypothetical protein CEE37_08110 [candidate division LCP-89 bacterium B3_LCP]
MDRFIQELIDLIKEEEKVLSAFLNLLNLQKQYLLADEIEQFQSTTQRQDELVNEIKKLENKRIDKVREFASTEGLRDDEITLTHLIEVTLGDVSEELQTMKNNLSKLVEKIHRANRVNEMLIKRSLNFIQKSIDWMIDSSDFTSLYDPNGNTTRQTGTNVIVNKVL